MCTPSWIFSPQNPSAAVHCHIYLSPILCALVHELFKQEELFIGLLWAVYLNFGPSSSKSNHSHETHFNGLVKVWSHSSNLLLHKKKAPTRVKTCMWLYSVLGGGLPWIISPQAASYQNHLPVTHMMDACCFIKEFMLTISNLLIIDQKRILRNNKLNELRTIKYISLQGFNATNLFI